MLRKIFKTGNSIVVSLPQEYLEALGIELGNEIEIDLDRKSHQLIIKPPRSALESAGVDEDFARQIDKFIEDYRPALKKLAE